ncbi:MAG: Tol-Pal system protein TolB [Rhodocyclaceae bacterium]|nr:Tol-Pal system protein TolB [Rhodocyclaceae bacterium]MBX3669052.1 Tol-Pal system protein TolB [Rhodocyclaceae bacterium]
MQSISTLLRRLLASALFATALAAHAELSIEISGAGAKRIPIAVANFEGSGLLPSLVGGVVRADLDSSKLFTLIEPGFAPLGPSAPVNAADWKARGADALVAGGINTGSDPGRSEARVKLHDTVQGGELGGLAFLLAPSQARAAGHRISDFVYEKLLGERGVFSTRIAYIVKNGPQYELQIADADGQNAQVALRSREPIISPAWAPDGQRLAYVSFEQKKPVIYVHTLSTGQRQIVANFKGSNSAPGWAPDGRRLAIVLTKDGGSQLYTVNADGSGVQRIMSSRGIDTEPQYSPDGQYIYFTSDRGGAPQIYRVPSSGGDAQRLTYEGSYNVTPRVSPDGKTLAYISRNGGRFQLTVMDLEKRQTQTLTDSARDESPSFAPNGRIILYATEIGGHGVLASVSTDGRVKQRLSVQAGDVREPAWGPYVQ